MPHPGEGSSETFGNGYGGYLRRNDNLFVEETSRVVMALLKTMVAVNMMAAMDLVEMESILEVMEATITSAITTSNLQILDL